MTSPIAIDFSTGQLSGPGIVSIERTIGEMAGIFLDERARQAIDTEFVIYRMQEYAPDNKGGAAGLYWGRTSIEPGLVGAEYFMTKGHLHVKRDRSEFYVTAEGSGALILMDEDAETTLESMQRGSVHYISGFAAHRVANTGNSPLSFIACWMSDAGHDYS
ncbi:MAG: glucose-6-phosphate isomerase, partial [Acidobacteriota bacterium]|nr:glucose-6-phosphate isomerase [Acidobacteriota bacterium]